MDRATEAELWVVRHGETPWNREGRLQGHTDIALSERGREQASALADQLLDKQLAFILTSDLTRARDTGAIVNARRPIQVPELVDPGLRERQFGLFEGLDAAQCRERFPKEYEAWRADLKSTIPGGEPWVDFSGRVMVAIEKAFSRLEERSPTSVGLVVTHGVVIRSIMLAIHGSIPTELVVRPIGNCEIFRIARKRGLIRAFLNEP